MKFKLYALSLAAGLLWGCSTPKYTQNPGTEVFQGTGGSNRAVCGIDFWEAGTPNQKYSILGTIEENLQPGPMDAPADWFGTDRDEAIAKIVRQQGGDGVIAVVGEAEPVAQVAEGQPTHRRLRTLQLIKYVN